MLVFSATNHTPIVLPVRLIIGVRARARATGDNVYKESELVPTNINVNSIQFNSFSKKQTVQSGPQIEIMGSSSTDQLVSFPTSGMANFLSKFFIAFLCKTAPTQ